LKTKTKKKLIEESSAVDKDNKRIKTIRIKKKITKISTDVGISAVHFERWLYRWMYGVIQDVFKLSLMSFIIAFLYLAMIDYVRGNWIVGLSCVAAAIAVGWLSNKTNEHIGDVLGVKSK
jgi:dolichol kinase